MNPEKQKPASYKTVQEAIESNSELLESADQIRNWLKETLVPGKVSTVYFDSANVPPTVEGYNLVYVRENGDLMHSLVIPDDIESLKGIEPLRESRALDNELKEADFEVDDTEAFFTAIHRQLNG